MSEKLSQAGAAASEFYAALNKLIEEVYREGVEEERKRQEAKAAEPWANVFGPWFGPSATTTTAYIPKPEPEPEKPLHVKVAEALGWTYRDLSEVGDTGCGGTVYMIPPGETSRSYCNACRPNQPPRYDTDWSATGPLIEKYHLSLSHDDYKWRAQCPNPARYEDEDGKPVPWCYPEIGTGSTPLIAVCNLILALKAEGKL